MAMMMLMIDDDDDLTVPGFGAFRHSRANK